MRDYISDWDDKNNHAIYPESFIFRLNGDFFSRK